ncbi:MAG: VCBS repeat-containing protein [Rhizobiales bacterium]|nr:VCBS repeat-containing protein [Hyphomicrobiales bacterium]
MATPVKLVEDTLFGYSQNFPTADPHVAALSDGSFIVTAEATDNTGDIDIVAERFFPDLNGGFSQQNFIFSGGFPGDIVNSTQSSVVGLSGNSIAVVWTNKPTDTNDADIHAKVFSLNGGGASTEIVVNVGDTAGNEVRPEVAELYPGGPLAFAWIDLATFTIKAAVFDQFGRAVATNMTVSTTEATNVSGIYDLGLTALANGQMVVSWTDDNNQSFFRVGGQSGFFNDQVALAGTGPTDVTALADGGFVVTYARGGASYATVFNGSGTVTAPEFQIATASGFEAVTALEDGRFMFAYSAGGNIWGSVWNADGTRSSNEFQINSSTATGMSRPHLETLADGTVAVTWEASSTNGPDIYSTIIDPREAGVQLAGTSFDDTLFGTRYADTIILGDGNDQTDAGSGDDQIFGGRGIDTIRGGAGNDKIDGGAGNFDTAVFSGVRAAYTLTDLGNGSVRVVGPDGTDTLTGIEALQFADRSIGWPPVTVHHAESDFGGDSISDILWRNSAGQIAVWQLDANGKPTSTVSAGSLATSWHVEDTGDFNADGKADILWHNDNGQTMIWTMNGSQHVGTINLGGVGTSWQVQGAADLSNDGTSDIVWRNTTGSLVVWNMTGTGQVSSTINLGSVSNAYHIQAFDDFNGDGKEDILWRNDNGQVVLWQMNGAQVAAGTTVSSLSSAWHIQGSGDFDGDGKADILWRSDTGQAAIWFMSGPQVANMAAIGTLSSAWQIETTGDYNGDGKDDILWRNTTTGQAAEWLMNGSHVAATVDLGKLPAWDVAHHQFDVV